MTAPAGAEALPSLFDPAALSCPFAGNARLRREAPVFRDPASGVVQVSTYELVAQAAADPATFSSAFGDALRGRDGPPAEAVAVMREGYPPVDTMLTADPPEHTRFRKLVNKAFTAARVTAMEPEIEAIASELIDGFIDAGEVELLSAFAQPFPLRVIAGQLGVPSVDIPRFRRWSAAFVAQLSQMAGPDGEVAAAREIVEFQHYFAARLEERRAAPRDDILSDLATVTLTEEGDPRPLTTAEALSIIQQVLVAGNETTANAITGGMKLLIEHPDQREAALADPGLIPGLVEEVLRLFSPVQNMWRVAARDCDLGGVAIGAGEPVLLRFGSANRDEARFADGEAFDIRRANARRHMAFGHGVHLCLGAALARKELVVAFRLLLARLREPRFAPGNDFATPPSILLRGLTHLRLAFDPPG